VILSWFLRSPELRLLILRSIFFLIFIHILHGYIFVAFFR
jgi:hypothetical protein